MRGLRSFSHAPVSRLGPPSSGFESETLPCKKNNLEKQKVYRTTEQGNGVGLFDFFLSSGHRTRGWWVGRGRVPAAVAARAVAAAPARPPALLLAPDEAVTARELLAVALDDEPEDTEADAHEPEADAEGQLTRRAADDHCLGVGVVAASLVVAFTQETFSASPENRRRIFPRNVQPASWGGGGCIYLFIVTSTIIRHLTTTNTNICKTPHAPPG